jgi:hypothetical protein
MAKKRRKCSCVYKLKQGRKIQRIGKGPCFDRPGSAERYLEERYGKKKWWDRYETGPCFSDEERAYNAERTAIERYQRSHGGRLPPRNAVGGGG